MNNPSEGKVDSVLTLDTHFLLLLEAVFFGAFFDDMACLPKFKLELSLSFLDAYAQNRNWQSLATRTICHNSIGQLEQSIEHPNRYAGRCVPSSRNSRRYLMKSDRMSSLFGVLVVVLIALCAITQARAQSNTSASMSDKHFVSEALKGGMAEVQMGQLAEEKAESNDVKNFGRKMVEDHNKLGDQMKQVASQIGVTAPTSPTMLDQVEIKKLSGLSGNDFDQEYIKVMVKDHEQDLKDFKKEADSGNSPSVKDAASQGADVISEHLSMIQQIAQSHNVAAK